MLDSDVKVILADDPTIEDNELNWTDFCREQAQCATNNVAESWLQYVSRNEGYGDLPDINLVSQKFQEYFSLFIDESLWSSMLNKSNLKQLKNIDDISEGGISDESPESHSINVEYRPFYRRLSLKGLPKGKSVFKKEYEDGRKLSFHDGQSESKPKHRILVDCVKEGMVNLLADELGRPNWVECRLAIVKVAAGFIVEFYYPPKNQRARAGAFCSSVTEVRETTLLEMPVVRNTFIIKSSDDSELLVEARSNADMQSWLETLVFHCGLPSQDDEVSCYSPMSLAPSLSRKNKTVSWRGTFLESKSPYVGIVSNMNDVNRVIAEYEIDTHSKFFIRDRKGDFGKSFGMNFSYETIKKKFLEEKKAVHFKASPLFDWVKDKSLVSFRMGSKYLNCKHGPIRCKNIKFRTKKYGCRCNITIYHLVVFPDYKDPGKTYYKKRKKIKDTICANIRNDVKMKYVDKYLITLPDPKNHKNHVKTEIPELKKVKPIAPALRSHIKELVTENSMYTVDEIKAHLEEYIKFVLFIDKPIPSASNTSYWPNDERLERCMKQLLEPTRRKRKIKKEFHSISPSKTDPLIKAYSVDYDMNNLYWYPG